MQARVALITGATSGIGKACAARLISGGWRVYGASRRAAVNGESPEGYFPLQMDVTDEDSVKAAVDELLRREGRLDAVINSAGWGIAGAAEEVTAAEVAGQIDVLALGVVRVCAAVLPQMRAQGGGRVINIGSVAGFITIPFQSAYSAGKYALEALTEAYRMELAPFNVQMCLIEPGDTRTGFTGGRVYGERARASAVYGARQMQAVEKMARSERRGRDADSVARVVMRVLKKRRMPVRRVVGFEYKLVAVLKKVLPARLVEILVQWMYLK